MVRVTRGKAAKPVLTVAITAAGTAKILKNTPRPGGSAALKRTAAANQADPPASMQAERAALSRAGASDRLTRYAYRILPAHIARSARQSQTTDSIARVKSTTYAR